MRTSPSRGARDHLVAPLEDRPDRACRAGPRPARMGPRAPRRARAPRARPCGAWRRSPRPRRGPPRRPALRRSPARAGALPRAARALRADRRRRGRDAEQLDRDLPRALVGALEVRRARRPPSCAALCTDACERVARGAELLDLDVEGLSAHEQVGEHLASRLLGLVDDRPALLARPVDERVAVRPRGVDESLGAPRAPRSRSSRRRARPPRRSTARADWASTMTAAARSWASPSSSVLRAWAAVTTRWASSWALCRIAALWVPSALASVASSSTGCRRAPLGVRDVLAELGDPALCGPRAPARPARGRSGPPAGRSPAGRARRSPARRRPRRCAKTRWWSGLPCAFEPTTSRPAASRRPGSAPGGPAELARWSASAWLQRRHREDLEVREAVGLRDAELLGRARRTPSRPAFSTAIVFSATPPDVTDGAVGSDLPGRGDPEPPGDRALRQRVDDPERHRESRGGSPDVRGVDRDRRPGSASWSASSRPTAERERIGAQSTRAPALRSSARRRLRCGDVEPVVAGRSVKTPGRRDVRALDPQRHALVPAPHRERGDEPALVVTAVPFAPRRSGRRPQDAPRTAHRRRARRPSRPTGTPVTWRCSARIAADLGVVLRVVHLEVALRRRAATSGVSPRSESPHGDDLLVTGCESRPRATATR